MNGFGIFTGLDMRKQTLDFMSVNSASRALAATGSRAPLTIGPADSIPTLFTEKSLHGLVASGALISAANRRPFRHEMKPALSVRKFTQILLLSLVQRDPRIAGHIGNAIFVCNVGVLTKPTIQNTVETRRLLYVAIDGVWHFYFGVLIKVVVLPSHRTKARYLPV